jgi:hypothetical protein
MKTKRHCPPPKETERDCPPPKIFPRNLTARADHIVRGNPANSRPESGVDNCYPGLEFDQRNLEQRFFPGLTLEFQRLDGAAVVAIDEVALKVGPDSPLHDRDSPPSRPLFLWFLYGLTDADPEVATSSEHSHAHRERRPKRADAKPEPTLFSFRGLSGSEVWRRVRDLLPGKVAILLGPDPGLTFSLAPDEALTKLKEAYDKEEDRLVRTGQPTPATVIGIKPGPWNLSGRTLVVTIRGPKRRQLRVSFRGTLGVSEVVNQINKRRRSKVAAESAQATGQLALTAPAAGSSSTLRVSGTAADVFGFSSECVRGSDNSGALRYAVLCRDRARYLDRDGVIDSEAYPPGELTKTMCAPWVYDFRDCYCFYWASNKPDVVQDRHEPVRDVGRYVNFLRRNRSDRSPDTVCWSERRQAELTYADLVQGGWHDKLPIVLDDRET